MAVDACLAAGPGLRWVRFPCWCGGLPMPTALFGRRWDDGGAQERGRRQSTVVGHQVLAWPGSESCEAIEEGQGLHPHAVRTVTEGTLELVEDPSCGRDAQAGGRQGGPGDVPSELLTEVRRTARELWTGIHGEAIQGGTVPAAHEGDIGMGVSAEPGHPGTGAPRRRAGLQQWPAKVATASSSPTGGRSPAVSSSCRRVRSCRTPAWRTTTRCVGETRTRTRSQSRASTRRKRVPRIFLGTRR